MRIAPTARIRHPYLGDNVKPSSNTAQRDAMIENYKAATTPEERKRFQDLIDYYQRQIDVEAKYAGVPKDELEKRVAADQGAGKLTETEGGTLMYANRVGPAARMESQTNRFLNWWRCDNAKASVGLLDPAARAACYARNTGLVIGGVAATFLILAVLKQMGD